MSNDNGSDVIVYGRSGCVQCSATQRKLDALGVGYQLRDVESSQGSLEAQRIAESLGTRQLPLVVAGERAWSGYQPDRLAALRPPVVGASSRQYSLAPARAMSVEV